MKKNIIMILVFSSLTFLILDGLNIFLFTVSDYTYYVLDTFKYFPIFNFLTSSMMAINHILVEIMCISTFILIFKINKWYMNTLKVLLPLIGICNIITMFYSILVTFFLSSAGMRILGNDLSISLYSATHNIYYFVYYIGLVIFVLFVINLLVVLGYYKRDIRSISKKLYISMKIGLIILLLPLLYNAFMLNSISIIVSDYVESGWVFYILHMSVTFIGTLIFLLPLVLFYFKSTMMLNSKFKISN